MERVTERHRPGTEIRFVKHVRGGAVLGGEIPDVDPTDLQRTGLFAADGSRPQLRDQFVDVGWRTEPGGNSRDTAVSGSMKGASFVSRHDL